MASIKCYYHQKAGLDAEACAKVGGSKGNILRALLSRGDCWKKQEKYVCAECNDRLENGLDEFLLFNSLCRNKIKTETGELNANK